jgi:hypothetical protein
MNDLLRYHVVLLPSGEQVATHCTLEEAAAYVHGYQEVVQLGSSEAVIAVDEPLSQGAGRTSRRPPPLRRSRALRSA